MCDRTAMLKALLDHGAAPNLTNRWGFTPLMWGPDCHAAEETCEHLLICPTWAEEREKIFGHREIQPTVLINQTSNTLEYLRATARLITRRPDPL